MRADLKRSARFRLQGMRPEVPLLSVKHGRFRKFLYALLGISILFAAGSFLVPYDLKPDPGARFRISTCMVRRDLSNYWVTVHVKRAGDAPHDLLKPVRLVTADGTELEPADTTFSGGAGEGTTAIWFKFWLETEAMAGPLSLKMNDGTLRVKSSSKLPDLADKMTETHTTRFW